ncbi:MAG: hypothetical protein IPF68_13060 [Bacteroidales bacterium]|nr:hypothetical protein [Bacteroidales bacterium]
MSLNGEVLMRGLPAFQGGYLLLFSIKGTPGERGIGAKIILFIVLKIGEFR